MSTAPTTMIATLTLAGLVSGTALAGVHLVSAPRIAKNQAQALERAVLSVVPGATRYRPSESPPGEGEGEGEGGGDRVYATWNAQGHFTGYAVTSAGPGFMDTIGLIYGYLPERRTVVGLSILDSRETPGLGDKIMTDPEFVGSFKDLNVKTEIVAKTRGPRSADNEVDCISGATISSKAVIAIIQQSVQRVASRLAPKGALP